MEYAGTCSECNREFTIKYDESEASLSFCPFCGSEIDEGDSIEDMMPLGNDDKWDDKWDDKHGDF